MFDLASVPNVHDQVAIVTGANVGLGYETTKALVQKGYHVVMACRNLDKAEQAKASLATYQDQLAVRQLDLASLQSVRAFSEDFLADYQRLDLLINNAGVMVPPYQTTEDGFELQFGANFLGHFLLTSLLLGQLEETSNARVVQLSSIAHRNARIHFTDPNFQQGYSRFKAYGQSKLAMLMFAFELDKHLRQNDYQTLSVAAHPGVSNTALSRHIPSTLMFLAKPIMKRWTQSPADGALPQLYAALGEDIEGGDYTGPLGKSEMGGGGARKVDCQAHARDEIARARLWQLACDLTGARWF